MDVFVGHLASQFITVSCCLTAGRTPGRNGVGILIDRSLKDGVVEVRRQGDRIILIRLVVGDSVLNVISAYAPQVGLSESYKRMATLMKMLGIEFQLAG